MCGRFVSYRSLEELLSHFPVDQAECDTLAPNYNISPTQPIAGIIQQDGRNILIRLHWGLVPSWAKDKSIGNQLINARSETLSTKPSFRSAFRLRRCLIPADGFYEWQTVAKTGKKQPYFFSLPVEKPFAFAGLWEVWAGSEQTAYRSCTLVTTDASESVQPIHHRMPVILKPEYYSAWLDAKQRNPETIQEILRKGIVTELSCRKVSMRVNSVRNNDAGNLEGV